MNDDSLSQFESVYSGEPIMEELHDVPWNIGEPQPPIAGLIEAGEVSGRVLDAGCGVGETSLHLAARGFRVLGVDFAPSAVRQAREAAAARGLDAEFEVADVTKLSGHDGEFDTVIDSTLFHSLPVENRSAYLSSVARAAAPGAVLHVLVFSHQAEFPGGGPHVVREEELREAVGESWTVDSVTPSLITAILPDEFASGRARRDEQGRLLMPGYLLKAHLPRTEGAGGA